MKKQTQNSGISAVAEINNIIIIIRGQKVILSSDLAVLYGVETKILIQAVKRNIKRFPKDFMFQLTRDETLSLKGPRSQIVTLKRGENIKYLPYAFTEQGIAMLSSVLNSEKAVEVNIQIMRAFVKLRQLIQTNTDLAKKLAELEEKYDEQFKVVFDALREVINPTEEKKVAIGFSTY